MSKRSQAKAYKKRIERLVKAKNILEAKKLYFEICNTTPEDEQAWYTAGKYAQQLGHTEDAGRAFHRATAINPNWSEAYQELASCQATLGFYDSAIQSFHNCLLINPNSVEALHQYAKLLTKLGRLHDGLDQYMKALDLNPHSVSLLADLGDLHKKLGDNKTALQHYRRAQALAPDNPDIYVSIGLLYRETGNAEKALENFRRFQQQLPGVNGVYEYYAATVAEEQGEFSKAETLFEKAIQLNPGSAKSHTAHALNLLRLGKTEKGWAEHEWRLRRDDWKQQPGHRPIAGIAAWAGESLQGKTVLVNAEQGYGDALQFCRYIPQLAELCNNVIIYCRLPLNRILRSLPGVSGVVSQPEHLSRHRLDVCLHMMSLPYVLSSLTSKEETVLPYLSTPTPPMAMKKKMAFNGLRVGLAWRGNPSHPRNSDRSLTLSQLQPLANVANVRFFKLQKTTRNEPQETAPDGMELVDLDEHISDFHDVAAAIGMLDLVISVDTAVAHLAGALGKQVWTMLYFPADWRWQVEGASTPWYPCMRLFRQQKTKQWPPVIAELANALEDVRAC